MFERESTKGVSRGFEGKIPTPGIPKRRHGGAGAPWERSRAIGKIRVRADPDPIKESLLNCFAHSSGSLSSSSHHVFERFRRCDEKSQKSEV